MCPRAALQLKPPTAKARNLSHTTVARMRSIEASSASVSNTTTFTYSMPGSVPKILLACKGKINYKKAIIAY